MSHTFTKLTIHAVFSTKRVGSVNSCHLFSEYYCHIRS